MNFLFPAAFFLGSLALPIVVLYLRRPSRRPLEFSSLLFWQRVLEREPHRKFLGRLRNPLSLILQLVILLLLLLALARPQESLVTRSSLDCSRPGYASAHASTGYL